MASVAAFDETRRQEGRAHLRLLASLLTEGGGEPETHDNIQLWRFIKVHGFCLLFCILMGSTTHSYSGTEAGPCLAACLAYRRTISAFPITSMQRASRRAHFPACVSIVA